MKKLFFFTCHRIERMSEPSDGGRVLGRDHGEVDVRPEDRRLRIRLANSVHHFQTTFPIQNHRQTKKGLNKRVFRIN